MYYKIWRRYWCLSIVFSRALSTVYKLISIRTLFNIIPCQQNCLPKNYETCLTYYLEKTFITQSSSLLSSIGKHKYSLTCWDYWKQGKCTIDINLEAEMHCDRLQHNCWFPPVFPGILCMCFCVKGKMQHRKKPAQGELHTEMGLESKTFFLWYTNANCC